MNPVTFNNEQFERILTELKSGTPLDQACRIAHVGFDVFRRELESSSHLSEIIDDACATARAQRQQARTYDDPVDNIGRDEPPTPAYEDKPKKKGRKGQSSTDRPVLDLVRARNEAAEIAPGMFGCFLWVNEQCAIAGSHTLSPWWRDTMREFHESGKRWWIGRAGRGSGKSTTLLRESITETLFGERKVPLGQVWPWIFVSVTTNDAVTRIVEAAAILNALGVEFTQQRSVGRLSLQFKDCSDNDVQFLSLASRIGSLSGPTAIGSTVDEEAKLANKPGAANLDTEILASLIQTFRGRDDAKGIRCSSAWGNAGSHAAAIACGDTSQNYVARIGSSYLARAVEGLMDVVQYLERSNDASGAKRVRDYAATVTATSPNVPTWVCNPTREAVECYQSNEALAAADGISLLDVFLRENASLPFDGRTGGDRTDYAYIKECNARIRDGGAGSRVTHTFNGPRDNGKEMRLQSFPGLPSYDPRSTRFGGGGRQGSTF